MRRRSKCASRSPFKRIHKHINCRYVFFFVCLLPQNNKINSQNRNWREWAFNPFLIATQRGARLAMDRSVGRRRMVWRSIDRHRFTRSTCTRSLYTFTLIRTCCHSAATTAAAAPSVLALCCQWGGHMRCTQFFFSISLLCAHAMDVNTQTLGPVNSETYR